MYTPWVRRLQLLSSPLLWPLLVLLSPQLDGVYRARRRRNNQRRVLWRSRFHQVNLLSATKPEEEAEEPEEYAVPQRPRKA